MKLKKGIVFTVILLLLITAMSLTNKVQAATGSLYLNLKMIRTTEGGYGYQLGNSRRNVWKIYDTNRNANDTIYCIKGGPGFGSDDFATGTPQETHYTRYFNLKDPDSIPATYQAALPDIGSQEYEALVWVLDHSYVAPTSVSQREQAEKNKEMLIQAAAQYAEDEGNPDTNGDYELSLLTDDDIDSVQQLAVWYFTNPAGDPYHVNTIEFYLNKIAGDDRSEYINLSDDQTFENGYDRAIGCQALFNYLVGTPQKPGFEYDITNSNSKAAPVQIADSNITTRTVGNRIIVGPYTMNEVRDIEYILEGKFLDAAGTEITDVIFLDEEQSPVAGGTTLQDLVGQTFYISIPWATDISNIEFEISGSFLTTTITYWSVADPTTKDQPVVIVEKEEVPFEDSIGNTEENKIFDLALRKFIVSIKGNTLTGQNDRTPQIATSELERLENGSTLTANKVHPKNALTVQTGDTVIYTIRVYNEGNVDGYATQITDYLPDGLTFLPDSDINKNYGWTNPSGDGKTIVTDYLKDKMLEAFNGTTLDYEDIQIECEVTATVGESDQSLKNIAEITAHEDKDGNTDQDLDRDSEPNNVDKDHYGNTSQEDDDDFENLVLKGQYFDLALRKFIVSVNNGTNVKKYNRAPKLDVTPLVNGTSTTAIYNHSKQPVSVSNGNEVIYTIRVYNEGQLDGYVTEITDYLPEQLEFIVDDELNASYGWTVVPNTDGREVRTDITSPDTSHSASRDSIFANRTTQNDKVLLKAFDGKTLDYIDVQIKCRVKENIDLYEKITNIAEITDFTDSQKDAIEDRDSQKDNVTLPTDETLPEYKDPEIERGDDYIPGQQDDDDFEKLVLQRFDLALRKFITGVNDKEFTDRAPVFTKTEDGEYTYVHPKDPVDVATGNIVTYTLRIFNEGNVAGYATTVKDDLPEGLEFLPDNPINTAFKWKMYREDGTQTTNVEEAAYIETDYLAKENETEEGEYLLDAFDPETMTMPDYKDLKIAFKVTEPNTSDRIIINTAEITEDSDENGDPIDDIDSTPDNDEDGEDDIDIEKVQVKYFDLSLKKWVTESIVTYNGKTTVTKTGHTGDEDPETPAKVDIRGSRMDKTTVKFKFNIKVTNEGEIAGYVKELIDYIPEGLEFVAEDNPKWREEDGKVLTDQLKDTLLEPGESATVEIILTWINDKNNLDVKVNWAEIYEDDNEFDAPDIDSTPGNDVKEEDDIDDAPVLITVTTGSVPTYITLALASTSMIATGVILIKKFVI